MTTEEAKAAYPDCWQLTVAFENARNVEDGMAAFRQLGWSPAQIIDKLKEFANNDDCRDHPYSRLIRQEADFPGFSRFLAAKLGMM